MDTSLFELKQLAQIRPANTTATSAYSPAANQKAFITSINVCNVSASSAAYRIFYDKDGTTYDETTALVWDVSLPFPGTDNITDNMPLVVDAGSIGVRTAVGDAINFTIFGEIKDVV